MLTDSEKAMLAGCGLPEEIIGASGRNDLPKPLRYFCSSLNFELVTELRAAIPGLRELIPIFGENCDAVVGFLPSTNQFVRFNYEDGNEGDAAIEVMGTGYVQFASAMLLENEEAGLTEYYASLVDFLKFPFGSELRELLDADPYDDEAVLRFHNGLAVK